jgi:hypothetical protein
MGEADSYVAKWLARQPEMELAQVFCAPSRRAAFRLWGALLQELDEAVYELSDASVTQAKLAWWGEELLRGANGAARHPLVQAVFAEPAIRELPARDWATLAQAALQVALDDRRAADLAAMIESQRPYAHSLARIESALFGGGDAAVAIAVERTLGALDAGELRWPLPLLARHQVDAAALALQPPPAAVQALAADVARQLAALLPGDDGGVFRRCRSALLRRRLAARAAGRDLRLGRFATLWMFWRAARRAPRNGS